MGEYKDALTRAMTKLAEDKRVCFIGYGVKIGGRAAGTLNGVPEDQLIETPVAENLMASMAIGLSLKGRIPVVYFERFDFVMNAMDAIVNHLDKLKIISRGEFSPAVIFRVVVGNKTKPLFTGLTHTQDLTEGIKRMVLFPVKEVGEYGGISYVDGSPADKWVNIEFDYNQAYLRALEGVSSMLIEYKDLI